MNKMVLLEQQWTNCDSNQLDAWKVDRRSDDNILLSSQLEAFFQLTRGS